MSDDIAERLLDEAAARHGVPANVLREMLALSEIFPDFAVQGSKTEFTRRIAAILDGAVARGTKA